MGDTSGQAYALTVFTPIRDGHEEALRAYLASLPGQGDSPLARLGTTHFARWLVLSDFVYQGPPQERDSLRSPYLVFTSNFDGDRDTYLEAMAQLMPVEADAIWSHCVGYPGTDEPAAFARYLAHNQLGTTFFVAAYPDSTVSQVRDAVATRARLTAFAIEAQSLPRHELREAFRARFVPSEAP